MRKFNQGQGGLFSLSRQWVYSINWFVLPNGRKSSLSFHAWASLTQALSQEWWFNHKLISSMFCLFFPRMMMRSRPVSMKRCVRISGSLRCLSGLMAVVWSYFTLFQCCYSLRTLKMLPETSSQKCSSDKRFRRADISKPQRTAWSSLRRDYWKWAFESCNKLLSVSSGSWKYTVDKFKCRNIRSQRTYDQKSSI